MSKFVPIDKERHRINLKLEKEVILKKPKTVELKISKSSLGMYQRCGRMWYYHYMAMLPTMTDYPRLCGVTVHRFVQHLHRPTKEVRPFFFKEKRSALNYWWFMWQEAVNKEIQKNALVGASKENTEKYSLIGAKCISNYWSGNEHSPRPIEIEKRYTYHLPGIRLVGIYDQLRNVSLPWISKHRPELIKNGVLHEAYKPVVIVDLKTERNSYDAAQWKKDPTLAETLRLQFELHEGLQPTMYTLLHELVTGKKPIAFCWYHMLSGKWFVTWREDSDYETLFGVIRHYRDNIAAESFPKHIDSHCAKCDYYEACRGNRHFIVSHPESPEEEMELGKVGNRITQDPIKQLRLKLSVKRNKATQMHVVSSAKPPLLRDLPWDHEEDMSFNTRA